MNEIVKGWIAPGTMGQNPGEVVRVWNSDEYYADMVHVVVVPVEEWERILGALRDCEHAGQAPYDPPRPECPLCGESKARGHAPDCTLASILRAYGGDHD